MPGPMDTNNVGSLRVLLVEDSSISQKLIHELLSGEGHSVIFANGGRKAVQVLKKEKYDLVLMDLNIPEMDGFKTAEAIRENEKETGGRIPIIAITSLSGPNVKEECMDAGMDGYISKPVDKAELLNKIESFFPQDR